METYETGGPIAHIASNLPDLINSNDEHDLQGAVLSAEYLREQNAGVHCSDNLLLASRNLLTMAMARTMSDKGELQPSIVGKVLFQSALNKAYINRQKVAALASLAQYKVATYETISEEEVTADFSAALAPVGAISRSAMRHDWVVKYYRNLLLKPNLTPNELVAINAGREVASENNKDLMFHLKDWFDGRRLSRMPSRELHLVSNSIPDTLD